MQFEDIGLQRLASQRIDGDKFKTPEAVVSWMGAMQAQDYQQALWAIGVRMPSATQEQVEQAIEDGKVVRTWPMRGTIHFVPAEDAGWMLELCASRVLGRDARRLKQLHLTTEIMADCQALFREALSGGERLTRSEMMVVLENGGIPVDGQRGYHILWYCAQAGTICMGPMQGKEQTFVLLDEWVPESSDLSREEALAELVRRFFISHGPATVYDFSRWSGLTVTDTRKGIQMVEPALISEEIDGQEYWMGKDVPPPKSNAESRVYLLPAFDEFVIGYKDRDAIVDSEHAHKIVPGNNGVFRPTIVIGGQNVGTWKRRIKKKTIDITYSPFAPLDDLEERAADSARSYSEFMSLPPGSILAESS